MEESKSFVKGSDGLYRAEFVAESDFSFHIEIEAPGEIAVGHSCVSGGRPDMFHSFPKQPRKLERDFGYESPTYPMYITITSQSPVTMAKVVWS